jgi:hypothetical protein
MAGNNVRIRASMDDKVSGPLRQIQDRFEKLGKSIGGGSAFGMGIGLAAGTVAFNALGRAAGVATDFIKDSIGAASALNESLGKSQVVFGKNAKEIEDWAETAADAFGQSKQQALEAAGTYGNLFRAFGVGRDEATKMSKTLVQLAADLASFNNTSIDDALLALRSGLSGETEPLKRYGIAISDARLRTVLLGQGVKNLGATLTPLQKSTAAYALIMKDSTLAQGDFARTSDGLANTQRSLDAAMKDLSAEIGANLVPVMTKLAKVAKDNVVPALGDAVDAAEDFAENTGRELKMISDAWEDLTDIMHDNFLSEMERVADKARDNLDEIKEAQYSMGEAARTAGFTAAEGMRRAEGAIADLGEEAEETADSIDDVTDALLRSLFGSTELKGELAEQQQKWVDLTAEVRRLEAIKNPTAEQRRDLTTTRGELAGVSSDILKTRTQLVLLDGTGLDSLIVDVAKLATKTGKAGDEARTLLSYLQRIAAQKGIPGWGGNPGFGRAHGGPVEKGVMYTVGENGPETFVAPASGTIIPNGGSLPSGGGAMGGGGSAPIHLHIEVGGREVLRAILDELGRGRGNLTFLPV